MFLFFRVYVVSDIHKMATPMRMILFILSVFFLLLIFNLLIVMKLSDDILRARLLRFQLTAIILMFMTILNCYVWRNLSTLMDSQEYNIQRDAELRHRNWILSLRVEFKDIAKWKNFAVKSLSWRVLLGCVQLSSMLCYASFSFLIATEPYVLTVWLFLCFAVVVQLFFGTVLTKVFLFIWTHIHKKRTRSKITKFHGYFIVLYALLIVSVGHYNVLQLPKIKDVSVPVKDLAKELNNFQITFVSDIHLGPTIGIKHLEKIVHMINYIQSGKKIQF